jgi:hypothetical protein
MVVISKTILADFGNGHSDAIDALNKWYEFSKRQIGIVLVM